MPSQWWWLSKINAHHCSALYQYIINYHVKNEELTTNAMTLMKVETTTTIMITIMTAIMTTIMISIMIKILWRTHKESNDISEGGDRDGHTWFSKVRLTWTCLSLDIRAIKNNDDELFNYVLTSMTHRLAESFAQFQRIWGWLWKWQFSQFSFGASFSSLDSQM